MRAAGSRRVHERGKVSNMNNKTHIRNEEDGAVTSMNSAMCDVLFDSMSEFVIKMGLGEHNRSTNSSRVSRVAGQGMRNQD